MMSSASTAPVNWVMVSAMTPRVANEARASSMIFLDAASEVREARGDGASGATAGGEREGEGGECSAAKLEAFEGDLEGGGVFEPVGLGFELGGGSGWGAGGGERCEREAVNRAGGSDGKVKAAGGAVDGLAEIAIEEIGAEGAEDGIANELKKTAAGAEGDEGAAVRGVEGGRGGGRRGRFLFSAAGRKPEHECGQGAAEQSEAHRGVTQREGSTASAAAATTPSSEDLAPLMPMAPR